MKLKLTLFFFLFLFFQHSFSQDSSPTGDWEGTVQLPNGQLEVGLTLVQEGKKKWSGSMDVPEQNLVDLPLTEMEYDGKTRKLRFNVPDIPGKAFFKGKLSETGDSLNGILNQSGLSLPMKLSRPDAATVAAASEAQEKTLANFRTFIDSLLTARKIPAVGVAIVKDGKVIMADGFGYRDLEQKKKADGKTLFGIGSCSKAFTSMCLAMLADDGKLDWEKPVKEYLPDFNLEDPIAEEYATAIDIMTHRIGLPRHDLSWMGAEVSREELFARLPHLPANKSFRSTWQYQNFMFMTAGILAGRLHGGTWEQMVEERIFKPLGMDASNLSVRLLKEDGNVAKTYMEKEDEVIAIPYRNIDAIGPAGSINSNAEDMAKWLQLHLGQGRYKGAKLVSHSELERMYTPYIPLPQPGKEPLISHPSYGLGWMVLHYHGHRALDHGGNIDGFSAEVFMLPEDGFGIAVMTNMDKSRLPSVLCFEAADRFLGFERENWAEDLFGKASATDEEPKVEQGKPIPNTSPSRSISQFAGLFLHPGYGRVEIKPAGDSLVAFHNGFEIPLRHWHYDVFMGHHPYVDLDYPFNFQTGSDGWIKAVEVPFELGADPLPFKLLPPARLSDPAFMETLAGEYDMKVMHMEVAVQGGHLYLKLPGQPDYKLKPLRGTTYEFADYSGFFLEFVMEEDGKKVKEMILTQPGAMVRGKPE